MVGIAVESLLSLNDRLAARGQLQTSRIFQVIVAAFLVYEAVIATLAGVHNTPPRNLNCALRERWEQMFRNKDGDSIRRIQDAFNCCGFNSPRDMAFPFPDNNAQGSEACMIRYDRNTGCVDSWREQERKVAVMLLIVPIAVFLWKVGQSIAVHDFLPIFANHLLRLSFYSHHLPAPFGCLLY